MIRHQEIDSDLASLCTRVEAAIESAASNERKTQHRQKAHRFVIANQVQQQTMRQVSFSLNLFDRGRQQSKSHGLPGFVGSRLPSNSQFQPQFQPQFPSPNNHIYYHKSPRASPHNIKQSLIVSPMHVQSKSQSKPQRPATSMSKRRKSPRPGRSIIINKKQRPASAAPVTIIPSISLDQSTATNNNWKQIPLVVRGLNSPTNCVNSAANSTNSTNSTSAAASAAASTAASAAASTALRAAPHRRPHHNLAAAALTTAERSQFFQQHFHRVQLQVYDRMIVQGIPQEHRTPRFTNPRNKPTKTSSSKETKLGRQKNREEEHSQDVIYDIETSSPNVEKRKKIKGKMKRRGSRRKCRNQKDSSKTSIMRVTVRMNQNSKPLSTRLKQRYNATATAPHKIEQRKKERLEDQQDEEEEEQLLSSSQFLPIDDVNPW